MKRLSKNQMLVVNWENINLCDLCDSKATVHLKFISKTLQVGSRYLCNKCKTKFLKYELQI